MFEIILFAPQIPPNTGNIIRLSANSGNRLHLVKPLGFTIDEKSCRRAGLDYHALSDVHIHDDLAACLDWLDQPRLFAITQKAKAPFMTAPLPRVTLFYLAQKPPGCQPIFMPASRQITNYVYRWWQIIGR